MKRLLLVAALLIPGIARADRYNYCTGCIDYTGVGGSGPTGQINNGNTYQAAAYSVGGSSNVLSGSSDLSLYPSSATFFVPVNLSTITVLSSATFKNITINGTCTGPGCGSGGGSDNGTVSAASQYSAAYYSLAGTTTTVAGISPVAGNLVLTSSGTAGPPYWAAPSGASGNFINNTSALQSGATFYVSSGTVKGQLTSGPLIINQDTNLNDFNIYNRPTCSVPVASLINGGFLTLGDATGVCGTSSALNISDSPGFSATISAGSFPGFDFENGGSAIFELNSGGQVNLQGTRGISVVAPFLTMTSGSNEIMSVNTSSVTIFGSLNVTSTETASFAIIGSSSSPLGAGTNESASDTYFLSTDTSNAFGGAQAAFAQTIKNPVTFGTHQIVNGTFSKATWKGIYDSSLSSLNGILGQATNTGGGNLGNVYGVYGIGSTASTGTITNLAAITGESLNAGGGTVTTQAGITEDDEVTAGSTSTTHIGIYAQNPIVNLGGVITTNYGMLISSQNAGGTNYGIYSNLNNDVFTGTATISGLSLSGVAGTQCLHSVGGFVTGTGSDCGSGGGSGGSSIYPATATASFPFGFSASTASFNGAGNGQIVLTISGSTYSVTSTSVTPIVGNLVVFTSTNGTVGNGGTSSGGGGGGGSSSLAVFVNSVQISSPTSSVGFNGSGVTSTNSGSSTTITISGGGGTPSGSNYYVQTSSNGAFGGAANLQNDGSTVMISGIYVSSQTNVSTVTATGVFFNSQTSSMTISSMTATYVNGVIPGLIAGTNISSITGVWPNQTINATGGGGGGSSTLAVQKNGVNISSPTVAINFLAPPFTVSLVNGATSQVGLDVSSVTLQGVVTAASLGALTSNQSITISSQANGSGTTSIALSINPAYRSGIFGNSWDGGGSALTAGTTYSIRLSTFTGAILTGFTLTGTPSGSVSIGVSSSTVFNTSLTSICASQCPTFTTTTSSSNYTLGGWTTSLSAGGYLYFVINSATTVTQANLEIDYLKP